MNPAARHTNIAELMWGYYDAAGNLVREVTFEEVPMSRLRMTGALPTGIVMADPQGGCYLGLVPDPAVKG